MRCTYLLFEDRLVIERRSGWGEIEIQTVVLSRFSPIPVRGHTRYPKFLSAMQLSILFSAVAVLLYLHIGRSLFDRDVMGLSWMILGLGAACLAAVTVMLITIRPITWARFEGASRHSFSLLICKLGPDAPAFDGFISAMHDQIARCTATPLPPAASIT